MKKALPLDVSSVSWSAPQGPFARGRSPALSMNNFGQLVLVYANSIWTPVPELRARVGELSDGTLKWHDERKFDTGSFPSVGINDQGQVVSTHQQNNGGESLFYNTGVINGNQVDWNNGGAGTFYTTGQSTTVDLNNAGFLVEVHKANVAESLWSMVGQFGDGTIDWVQESKQFDSGRLPSVALNNSGQIAQFHETTKFFPGRIFDNAGELDDGHQVKWFGSQETDGFLSGTPMVDMNDAGVSVQIHISTNGAMYYRVGQLSADGRSIAEGQSIKFLHAFEYDIAMSNDGQVVVVYTPEDTTKAENLYYIVGTLSS